MKQRPAGEKILLLTKEMKVLTFVIGIITDLLLIGLFFWLFKFSGYEILYIRSVIFAGLAIDSIFYIFSCKSLRKNIWEINLFSNRFLILAWIFAIMVLIAGLYLPPFQTLLKTQPLDLFGWKLVLGLGFLNIILIEATKWYFITKSKIKIQNAKR
jgi:Ca2+-transporting ATPase